YRSVSGMVPEGYYTTEIGKAQIVQEGNDCTIVTYGFGVHWALEVTKKAGINNVEIIDLRTLLPWDKETVAASVKKTGKVLVLHEDTITGGIGGEIAAWISENCFEYLDAPVKRLASLDTPVPFAPNLEWNFLPKSRIAQTLNDLLNY
ncbi:MAG TPA: transketolase C-terminal domain-containing protein, partial [Bacteroidia bacterium]